VSFKKRKKEKEKRRNLFLKKAKFKIEKCGTFFLRGFFGAQAERR